MVRPQRVLTQSPDRNWDRIYAQPSRSPRGRRGGGLRGLSRRPQPLGPSASSTTKGLEPWSVDAIWLGVGPNGPTHYVDITATVDRKIEALLCHKSQLPDPTATETMVRGWTSAIAQLAGLPEGRYAEAVREVNTR